MKVKRGRRGFARFLGWVGLLVGMGLAGPALGQSENVAAAEALFRQGLELFEAGDYAQACAKFEESQRLDPSPGTLLNLARCNEAAGKTASAWSGYLAAKRAAQAAGRAPLAEEAARRASELQGKLSYLTVQVTRPVEGLEVHRDDVVLNEASLGAKLPIDPGSYQLRARAPGYEDWSVQVTLEDGTSQVVTIPELKPEPAASPATPSKPSGDASTPVSSEGEPARPEPEPPAVRQAKAPVAAFVVGGAGLVVTGVGFAFGGLAKSAYDSALDECPSRTDCSPSAMDARDQADGRATVATVLVPVGLVGVTTGALLWGFHKSKKKESRLQASIAPLPGGTFAHIRGAF